MILLSFCVRFLSGLEIFSEFQMVNCVVIYTSNYTNRIITNFDQLFEIILKLFSISCLESFNITLNNFQIFFFIRKFDELRLELINCRCIKGINVGILFYIYFLMWLVWLAWFEVFARVRSDMFSVCLSFLVTKYSVLV